MITNFCRTAFTLLLLIVIFPVTQTCRAQGSKVPRPQNPPQEVRAETLLPVLTYRAQPIHVGYLNPYRYDYNPASTITTINGGTVPSLLQASTAAVPKAATAPANLPLTSDAHAAAPPPPFHVADCEPTAPKKIWDHPLVGTAQTDAISQCWNQIEADAVDVQINQKLTPLRQGINTTIRSADKEKDCYDEKVQVFSAAILSSAGATQLLTFAANNRSSDGTDNGGAANGGAVGPAGGPAGCRQANAFEWNLKNADGIEQGLLDDQAKLKWLAQTPDFDKWLGSSTSANKIANTALSGAITSALTEVRSYSTGSATAGTNGNVAQTLSDFKAVVSTNLQWRDRLKRIDDASKEGTNPDKNTLLVMTLNPHACTNWYGKGAKEDISLMYADVSSKTAQTTTLLVATNTCVPSMIASSGIGISFLKNPTYGFVPDATGAQVIGLTAVNNVQPLYGLFYHVRLPTKPSDNSIEWFATPGVGLVTSSSTTTTDFLAGISMGLAHRTIFITPSVDIGQRTQLTPPFAIGSPKIIPVPPGAPTGTTPVTLSAVPTQTVWKTGFMISISFGIAPSQ